MAELLKESPYIHEGGDTYPINEESRTLREEMEAKQGLGKNEVATYIGRLIRGVRRDGKIYSKQTGEEVGTDPYPND